MLQLATAADPPVDITDPGSVADRLSEAVAELTGSVVAQLPLILLGITVLVVSLVLASFVQRGVVRATDRPRMDAAVARLVQVLARVVMVVLAMLLALSVAGVDVGSALAALGIAGLAIAFAVQSILENFIAGILILVRRPFRPGDQVELGTWRGTVEDVNLRVTKIVDFDGQLVLLPNNTVFAAPILNLTQRGSRRTEVFVGIDYRDDHDRARAVLLGAVSGVDGVLAVPPPEVLLAELGESAVRFAVRYWTAPQNREVNRVQDLVLAACKRAVTEAGMTIPWPIRTLVMDGDAAALSPRRQPD